MMQKTYFGDMSAAYVATDNTSTGHVDVFKKRRHVWGRAFDSTTCEANHVVESSVLEHQTLAQGSTNRHWLQMAR
jgi:hypothetical protein